MKVSKTHKTHLGNVAKAVKSKKADNENYIKYMNFAYQSCLLEEDKRALRNEDKSTFEFNVLGPHINAQLKNLADVSASRSFDVFVYFFLVSHDNFYVLV